MEELSIYAIDGESILPIGRMDNRKALDNIYRAATDGCGCSKEDSTAIVMASSSEGAFRTALRFFAGGAAPEEIELLDGRKIQVLVAIQRRGRPNALLTAKRIRINTTINPGSFSCLAMEAKDKDIPLGKVIDELVKKTFAIFIPINPKSNPTFLRREDSNKIYILEMKKGTERLLKEYDPGKGRVVEKAREFTVPENWTVKQPLRIKI